MACPPLTETQYCNIKCSTCVMGPLEYGPCTPTCTNFPGATGHRKVTRGSTPIIWDSPSGPVPLAVCPFAPTIENCSIPCCPVDCIMTSWSQWGDCIDGVKNRTRTIINPPICGGAICPDCLLEQDVCTYNPPKGECAFGEACEEGSNLAS